jgi:hypothetical protein
MAHKGLKGLKVDLAHQVLMARRETKEIRETKVIVVRKENRVNKAL